MVLTQVRYVPLGLDMFRYAQLDMDSASPRYATSLRRIARRGTRLLGAKQKAEKTRLFGLLFSVIVGVNIVSACEFTKEVFH